MSYFSCSIRFFFSFHFFGSFSKINFKFFLAIKLYRINKQQHIFNQYAHDIDSAELWVAGMNAAATKLKIPIQYCMTLPVPPFNIALLGRYSVFHECHLPLTSLNSVLSKLIHFVLTSARVLSCSR